MSVHRQVNRFDFSLSVAATGRTCTVLVSLGVAAIDENPFNVGFNNEHLEDLEPLA